MLHDKACLLLQRASPCRRAGDRRLPHQAASKNSLPSRPCVGTSASSWPWLCPGNALLMALSLRRTSVGQDQQGRRPGGSIFSEPRVPGPGGRSLSGSWVCQRLPACVHPGPSVGCSVQAGGAGGRRGGHPGPLWHLQVLSHVLSPLPLTSQPPGVGGRICLQTSC